MSALVPWRAEIERLGAELLGLLVRMDVPADAGSLIREFCEANDVDATAAEVALSLLLNQGRVIADREMHLALPRPERGPA